MRATLSLAASFVLAVTLTGCATLAHGTTQQIPIASSPPGAQVLVDDVPAGVTPMVAKLSRKEPHIVSFVVDSVTIDRVPLERSLSPWVYADFLAYIAPAINDFKNGAAYNLPRDTIRPRPGGLSAGVWQPTISPGLRASAVTSSTMFGFGSGHAIAGVPGGGRFLAWQMAGGSVAFLGLMAGIAGSDVPAAVMFFGGGGVLIGSRISEVVDLVKRIDPPRRR